ncbi:MAG: hypothetical protein LW629_11045 [Burkholderiales bacterium]|nr:hypothetical protein [Burkholderiales bacterium]
MMDQANTLRNLLGTKGWPIVPVMGDMNRDDASLLAAFMVDAAAEEGNGGAVVDCARYGLVHQLKLKMRYDLSNCLNGDLPPEAVALGWGDRRVCLPSNRGLELLACTPLYRQRLLHALSGLLNACDEVYVTLPFSHVEVACELSTQAPHWLWIVEPNSHSVTQCYKAMRHAALRCGKIAQRVLVARVKTASEADNVFAELEHATRHFFSGALEYAGQLSGPQVALALRARTRIETQLVSQHC